MECVLSDQVYRDLFEFGSIDVTIAIPIKDLESLPEFRGVVLLLRLLPHHLKEFIKVNCPVSVDVEFYHQVEHLILSWVLAHGSHHW